MLKEKDLKKIREALPKNGYQLVADKSGYKKSMVGKVMRGERQSQTIIDNALEVIKEHKQRIADLQAKVNTLTK